MPEYTAHESTVIKSRAMVLAVTLINDMRLRDPEKLSQPSIDAVMNAGPAVRVALYPALASMAARMAREVGPEWADGFLDSVATYAVRMNDPDLPIV